MASTNQDLMYLYILKHWLRSSEIFPHFLSIASTFFVLTGDFTSIFLSLIYLICFWLIWEFTVIENSSSSLSEYLAIWISSLLLPVCPLMLLSILLLFSMLAACRGCWRGRYVHLKTYNKLKSLILVLEGQQCPGLMSVLGGTPAVH